MSKLNDYKRRILSLILAVIIIIGFIIFSYQKTKLESEYNSKIDYISSLINKNFNTHILNTQNEYNIRVDTILNIDGVTKALASKDREKLYRLVAKRFKAQKEYDKSLKIMTFRLVDGSTFLRVHKPQMYGDKLNKKRTIIIDANKKQKRLYGFEIGKLKMSYRIVTPIFHNNKHIGVVEVGVSPDKFINNISDIFNIQNALVVKTKDTQVSMVKKEYLNIDGFSLVSDNIMFKEIFKLSSKKYKYKNSFSFQNDKNSYIVKNNLHLLNQNNKLVAKVLLAYDVTSFKQNLARLEQEAIISLIIISLILFIVLNSSFNYYIKEIDKSKNRLIEQTEQSNRKLSTKVKEKIKELNIQNRKLESLVSSYDKNVMYSKTDLEGIITDVSDAFCKTSGYTREEMIGVNHNIVRHPDIPKEIFKDLWKQLKQEKTFSSEVKNLKKDGGYYWIRSYFAPDYDENGNHIGYTCIRENITDRKKLEDLTQYQENIIEAQVKIAITERDRAQKYAEAKSEFLANMSHEIRTPLNAILGFVGLLKEQEYDKEKLKYLTTVDKSSHSLLSIINDILDFSKIESGKIDIEKINFDSFEEFETVAELFKAKCKEKNIIFNINLDKDMPKFLNSDIQKLRQVISNLLSNAIKFTSGGKRIELKVYCQNERLFISVKDEGIGIPKNAQKNIFEAFSQADISTTRKFGGTGLGLSISNAFVKLLDGELELESKENIGSRFHFSIPIEIGQEIKKDRKITDTDILKGKILVVEDNKANQMFMKVILKKIGLSFEIANDGIEAVDMFKENAPTEATLGCRYDMILMDENMPNMGGIEAMKNILKIEKEQNLKHTPIIALTANALKGDRERFIEAGMDEYLTKPVDKKKLSEVLRKFLNR